MLEIFYDALFLKKISKIKNVHDKNKIKKQITKIINTPTLGKPMKYSRKNSREVYISPYRLAYAFFEDKIVFLDIYHKDEQ